MACEKNEPHIANFLLENGADVEQTNAVGSTALHVAAGRGALEAVRVALKFTANVRAQNAIGSTPLHCAAFAGAAEICAALLLEDTRPAEFLEMRNLCGACAADVAADGSVRKVLEGFKGGGKRGNDPERKNVGEAKRDGQNGGVKTGKVKSEAAGDRKGGIE